MPTDANIGNMALSRLGTQSTITDLTENSTEARQLNIWYATVRDDLLGMIDWNFNRVRRPLSQSGTPPSKWAYSYAYPSDCLKIWGIDFGGWYWSCWNGMAIPFEIASDGTNQFLYCDEAVAEVVFGQRVTDPNRFTPGFVMAFADCLAAAVAFPITQKIEIAARLGAIAQARLEKAEVVSANEQSTTDRFQVAESVAVRGYEDGRFSWLQGVWR